MLADDLLLHDVMADDSLLHDVMYDAPWRDAT
jgi:hypothetical protein